MYMSVKVCETSRPPEMARRLQPSPSGKAAGDGETSAVTVLHRCGMRGAAWRMRNASPVSRWLKRGAGGFPDACSSSHRSPPLDGSPSAGRCRAHRSPRARPDPP